MSVIKCLESTQDVFLFWIVCMVIPEPEPLCQRVALGLYDSAHVTMWPNCTLAFILMTLKLIGRH